MEKEPSSQRAGAKRSAELPGSAAVRRIAASSPEVAQAIGSLRAAGLLSQGAWRQFRVRLDPEVLKAAGNRLGLKDTTDIINAALAVVAAPEPFKEWLRDPQTSLPDDFELGV